MNYQTTMGSFAEKSEKQISFFNIFSLSNIPEGIFGSKTTLDTSFSRMDKMKRILTHLQKCKCTSIIYCQNISGNWLGVVH